MVAFFFTYLFFFTGNALYTMRQHNRLQHLVQISVECLLDIIFPLATIRNTDTVQCISQCITQLYLGA